MKIELGKSSVFVLGSQSVDFRLRYNLSMKFGISSVFVFKFKILQILEGNRQNNQIDTFFLNEKTI